MWEAGQRIGDYELVAHLRAGGMATLFLARRLGAAGFSREVAIKIIHPELASDEQFRTMFLDEALLSSRIQHPNVVRVEELGEHQGSHFLAMEYVHGCSLSQLQRQLVSRGRRLAAPFATRIAMHVAEALHAAHETRDEQGRLLHVVHRDVSPENVLLAYAGHVKLIDFGIAKAYGRKHQTREGLLKGKFRYMAPEQAYGKHVDRRTDIYQLGIVLWEMLTLRRLFDAETDVDLIAQVREPTHVVPPSALVDRIPSALDAAVMSALHPDPNRRPPDAQTFARMLGKAAPDAREVDAGALSALVCATMHEHRQREKGTFPPQVYEQLEQQIPTQQIAGSSPDVPAQPVLKKYTVEHTTPYGSDVPASSPPPPGGRSTPASTQPGYDAHDASRGRAAPAQAVARSTGPSHPPRASESRPSGRPSPVGPAVHEAPRKRRLVRLASEIRTTITRIAGDDRSRGRMLWAAVGGAVGLAGALALVTWALRREPVALPPPPPAPVPMAVPAPGPATTSGTTPAASSAPAPPHGALEPMNPTDAPSVMVAPSPAPSRASDDAPSGRSEVKLPAPVDVGGTPMIPEF